MKWDTLVPNIIIINIIPPTNTNFPNEIFFSSGVSVGTEVKRQKEEKSSFFQLNIWANRKHVCLIEIEKEEVFVC